jgi:hypothetical protein
MLRIAVKKLMPHAEHARKRQKGEYQPQNVK